MEVRRVSVKSISVFMLPNVKKTCIYVNDKKENICECLCLCVYITSELPEPKQLRGRQQ